MGVSYSCSGTDYDALDEGLQALIMRTLSFKGEDVDTAVCSVNSNVHESESESLLLEAIGSGKMIIEGSLSFNGRESDPFHVETKFSIKSPRIQRINPSRDTNQKPSRFKASLEAIEQQRTAFKTGSPEHEAAVKLQKVYKSFRTRRKLADCAVLVEQRWWKLLDFALLKRSSVSFFDIDKPESVISRWSRARTRAAKVGQGLSKDEKAQKLALQHWLEAIDPRHRYGHNLHFYYSAWLNCESRQPFFYWLDVGEGKEVNLERCPRSRLRQECIKYLGLKEREEYEVLVKEEKFMYKIKGNILDTTGGPPDAKWIFVLSTSKKLYVGQKKKGKFQHSSFLAGGATSAAGRLVVERGILKAVWPHSGHYRPTEQNFQEFVSFLEENNVDLTDVKKSPDDETEWSNAPNIGAPSRNLSMLNSAKDTTRPQVEIANNGREDEAGMQQFHRSSDQTSLAAPETSVAEEPKGLVHDVAPTRWQPTPSRLQVQKTSLDHLHAVCLQKLFKEFEGESDEDLDDKPSSDEESKTTSLPKKCQEPTCSISSFSPEIPCEASNGATSTSEKHYKKNLFKESSNEGEESVIPRELILHRINSKKGMKSYQLGKQLSCKWTTGAGPRIGCVRDYPSELQFRALEEVNLSPRSVGISKFNASSPYSLPSSTPKTPGMSPLRTLISTDVTQTCRR